MTSQKYRNTKDEYLGEELRQCPYNPAHMVRPGTRWQRHMIKCRQNHLEDPRLPGHQRATRMVVCKFDSGHHVLQEELEKHYSRCEGRKAMLEMVMAKEDEEDFVPLWKRVDHTKLSNAESEPVASPAGAWGTSQNQPQQSQADDDDENWDGDGAGGDRVPAYDPMKKVLESRGKILFNPQNQTRSKKRLFRQNQRMLANGAYGEDDAEHVYGGMEHLSPRLDARDECWDAGDAKEKAGSSEEFVPLWKRTNHGAAGEIRPRWSTGEAVNGFGRGRGRGRGIYPEAGKIGIKHKNEGVRKPDDDVDGNSAEDPQAEFKPRSNVASPPPGFAPKVALQQQWPLRELPGSAPVGRGWGRGKPATANSSDVGGLADNLSAVKIVGGDDAEWPSLGGGGRGRGRGSKF